MQPVRLETAGGDGAVRGTLVTRTGDERHVATALEEGDEVSIVTTRMRAEDERRGPWRVGDAVFDSEFGLGVVQAFRGAADEALVVVRFDDGGTKRVPLERAELRPIRSMQFARYEEVPTSKAEELIANARASEK